MLEAAFVFWALGFLLFSRLPTVGDGDGVGTLVSVVVPARNEEDNISRLVESLRAQGRPPLEILVVDDGSTDATAERASASGASVVRGEELPDGWAGKPWACWQGAQRAKGELLLFLDADTWLEPGALGRLVATFRQRPGLMSVQPYHQMASASERLGALFNLITMMGSGAFTALGPRVEPRLAFGPCAMADRETYLGVGGHSRAKRSVVEGSELAKAFREAGHPVRCFSGMGSVSFRMYADGPRSMTEGLSKSFATGAGSLSPRLLVAIVAWVVGSVTTTRHLIVGGVTGTLPEAALLLYGLYALQLRWMLGRVGNYGLAPALFFPVPVAYFLGVFSYSFFRTFVRGDVSWKGRSVETK